MRLSTHESHSQITRHTVYWNLSSHQPNTPPLTQPVVLLSAVFGLNVGYATFEVMIGHMQQVGLRQ